jgi:hypothetical protein
MCYHRISIMSRLLLLVILLVPALSRAESPRRFALEIKFAPYIPAIDSSPGLTGTPFSDTFGDPADPRGAAPSRFLLTQLEFDWQLWNRFGSLGVGLSAGYFRKTARQFALFNDRQPCAVGGSIGEPRTYTLPGMKAPLKPEEVEQCFSGDENSLNVFPISLLAVYRFDVLDRRYRIPLIPYMKAGLAYYVWWMGTSSEITTSADDRKAAGGTFGFVLHPGLAVNLGFFDREAGGVMDRELGLNRVSLFVEMHYAVINNFGSPAEKTVEVRPMVFEPRPTTLDLSDLTFNAGLAFEF